jgi:hypothetical protein
VAGGGPKHSREVNRTVSALLCERLQAQVVFQIPHTLLDASHRVARQGGGRRPGWPKPACLRENEKPERKRLRQVICVESVRRSVFVGGGEKKLEELLCRTVLDVDLQPKVSRGSGFQLGVHLFDERRIQGADEELEFGT